MVDFLFLAEPEIDEGSWNKTMALGVRGAVAADAVDAFAAVEFVAAELKAALEAVAERYGQKLGKAQAPVRVAVTGRTVGPPLFESLEVLGRDETLRRLRAALERLGRC